LTATSSAGGSDLCQALLEHSATLVTVLDSDGVIRYATASCAGVLGYAPDDLLDASAFDFIHPDDQAVARSAFAQIAVAASCDVKVTFRFRHANGEWRVLDVIGTNHSDDPVIRGIVVNARDCTDRAHAMEERDTLLQTLLQTNQRLDEFLAFASHELKTPLTSVGGNIQVAERRLKRAMTGDALDLEGVELLLARAQKGVDRMTLLVSDLLDASRIKSDRLVMQRKSCELIAIIREAIDELRDLDPARTLSAVLPAEAVPVIADPARVEQVVLNFLTNALTYAPADKPIEIGARVEGAEARVWVRDHGPGLAPADQERIWGRFNRVERVQRQAGSHAGLGLGLYISKTIIEQHGGRIGVESVPGAGATFWFTLARESAPVPAPAA